MDRKPLHKSTSAQLLCQFCKLHPFIAALFFGNGKPTNVKDFLSDILIEFVELQKKWL